MRNLANPQNTSSSGCGIHTPQPSSLKSQELRKKWSEFLWRGFGTELIYRNTDQRLSQIWAVISDYSGERIPPLTSEGTFTMEQPSIIFLQLSKKTAGKYLVVLCKHPRFFSLKYIMLHNYIDEPSARLKLNKGTDRLNWWVHISANSPEKKSKPGKD